ncbi:MAG: YicC/YloC family endoribonuclease [Salinarimonas sp.]
MTIASMTGFARVAGTTGPYAWAFEAKAVNGRGLEIRLRVPPGYDAIGEAARRALAQRLGRGQIQLSLTLTRASRSARARLDVEALESLVAALKAVRLPDGIAPATLDGLLAVRGIVEIEEGDDSDLAAALEADLAAALPELAEALVGARAGEGAALESVIRGQIDAIASLVAQAEAHPGRAPEAIRARLSAQVAALLETGTALDPDRLHQEAVLIATRADIREELDRLAAHVEQARALLDEGGVVGRKLDFLAQEFGREANTLCAKANDVGLSRIGLSLKAAVEQLREQVQNVE